MNSLVATSSVNGWRHASPKRCVGGSHLDGTTTTTSGGDGGLRALARYLAEGDPPAPILSSMPKSDAGHGVRAAIDHGYERTSAEHDVKHKVYGEADAPSQVQSNRVVDVGDRKHQARPTSSINVNLDTNANANNSIDRMGEGDRSRPDHREDLPSRIGSDASTTHVDNTGQSKTKTHKIEANSASFASPGGNVMPDPQVREYSLRWRLPSATARGGGDGKAVEREGGEGGGGIGGRLYARMLGSSISDSVRLALSIAEPGGLARW